MKAIFQACYRHDQFPEAYPLRLNVEQCMALRSLVDLRQYWVDGNSYLEWGQNMKAEWWEAQFDQLSFSGAHELLIFDDRKIEFEGREGELIHYFMFSRYGLWWLN